MKNVFSLFSVLLILVALTSTAVATEWVEEEKNKVGHDEEIEYSRVIYEQPSKIFGVDNQLIGVEKRREPLEGSVRIVEERWAGTSRYADTSAFGLVDSWKYRALEIGSIVLNNVGKTLCTAASIVGVELDASSDYLMSMYVSKDRVWKKAEIYTSNGEWKTYFSSVNREWYAHYIVSDSDEAREDGIDTVIHAVHKLGCDPIYVEEAEHFDDRDYLIERAQLLYREHARPEEEYWDSY